MQDVLNFDLESRVEGDRAIVTVSGDFDLQVAQRVVDELAKVEAAPIENRATASFKRPLSRCASSSACV